MQNLAPNRHLFQNTANFYRWSISTCCWPGSFLSLLNLSIWGAILCTPVIFFCRLLYNCYVRICNLYYCIALSTHALTAKNGNFTNYEALWIWYFSLWLWSGRGWLISINTVVPKKWTQRVTLWLCIILKEFVFNCSHLNNCIWKSCT